MNNFRILFCWIAMQLSLPFMVFSGTWDLYTNNQDVTGLAVLQDTIWATTGSDLYSNLGSLVGVSRNDSGKVFYNKYNYSFPVNNIRTMCISSNKSRYFGTDSGLVAYDGNTFKIYSTSNSKLPNNTIYSLMMDKSGWLWIGTYRGLAKLKDDSMFVFSSRCPLSSSTVQAIFMDSLGDAWLNDGGYLYRCHDSIWTTFRGTGGASSFGPVSSMAQDKDGVLWFTGFYTSLFSFDGQKWLVFDSTTTRIRQYSAHSVFVDGLNRKFISTDSGLVMYDNSSWNKILPFDNSIPKSLGCISSDITGRLYFASSRGIVTFKDGEWNRIDIANSGLPTGETGEIVVDHKNQKWIGTTRGLVRFDGQSWTVFNKANSGLPDDTIGFLAVGPDDAVWAKTRTGAARYKQGAWKIWQLKDTQYEILREPQDWMTMFKIDKNNRIWIGTYERSTLIFDTTLLVRNSILAVPTSSGAKGAKDVVFINDSLTWLGVSNISSGCEGIYVIGKTGGTLLKDQSNNNFCFDVLAMALDIDGSIWVGTEYNGVMHFKNGIPASSISSNGLIWCIAVDKQGNKWFGGEYGVTMSDGSSSLRLSPLNSGIIDPFTNAIAVDSTGDVWISSRGGLSVFHPQNGNAGIRIDPAVLKTNSPGRPLLSFTNSPLPRIGLFLAKSSFVNISIFDIQGRRIRTVVNTQMQEGNHSFSVNPGSANSQTRGFFIAVAGIDGVKSTARFFSQPVTR